MYAIAFIDGQVHDAAGRFGADLDEALRLNLARGRHDRFEVAGLDHVGRDRQPLFLLEIEVRADDGAGHDHDSKGDEYVLARHLSS
jgi:hypothetical protein